jgi:hypothetical protein
MSATPVSRTVRVTLHDEDALKGIRDQANEEGLSDSDISCLLKLYQTGKVSVVHDTENDTIFINARDPKVEPFLQACFSR